MKVMEKYKFIGITELGYNNLWSDDIESLEEMIGCEIVEHKKRDGGIIFYMPDGILTHSDFLQVEKIK